MTADAHRRGALAAMLAVALVALSACSGGSAPAAAKPAVPAFAETDWSELIPPAELENQRRAFAFAMRHVDHSSDQRAPQFGSFETVAALDGRRVALPGYVVPLDVDGEGRMSAYFFVPTLGACIHVPPPPPDQIVYVTLTKPVPAPELGDSRWLRGTLHVRKHDADLASAAYAMDDPELAPRPLDGDS
ncbi:MAG TPA: DUF3299 domain-containing protein [Dokdonella sp.]